MNMSVIKKLKPILFPVRIEEAKSGLNKGNALYKFNKNLDHWVVVKTEEGDLVVNACSKGYTLVNNSDLLIPLITKLEERYKVEVIVKHYRHAKFYVDFVIKDFYMRVHKHKQKEDYLYPRLRVINSYDGSITFRFNFGFFRPFCENMINVNSEILDVDMEDEELEDFTESIKMRHTVSVKDGVNQALKSLEVFVEAFPKLRSAFRNMTKKIHKDGDEVLKQVASAIKYPPTCLEFALAQLQREKEHFSISDYIIYNCLNYGIYHNPKSQMKDHKKDKIDLRALQYLSKQ